MRIRMLPVSTVFNKFPRLVRDLAQKSNKQVKLVIEGEDTELDRVVVDEIGDPLLQLLHNAVDHGLETPGRRRAAGKPECGTILLTAQYAESRIRITVEDDGQGIDTAAVRARAVRQGLLSEAEAAALSEAQAIQLIFHSGPLTAETASDISGQGEGPLHAVRTSIERLNGTIAVETQPGRGTQFQIAFPLALTIIPALLVHVGVGIFAIPLASVVEVHRVPPSNIHTVNGRPVVQVRGQVLPLIRMNQALGIPLAASQPPARSEYVVAVRWGKTEVGLIVEKLMGTQDVVVKSLGALMGGRDLLGISGAVVLGDGRVALIINVPGLLELASA